jgi:hypothetical protein
MDKQVVKIYFVTWPDGQVVEGSQSSRDRDTAIRNVVLEFLPDRWFNGIELGTLYYGPLSKLWDAMKKNGFKIHEIDLPDDIKGID